MPLVTQAITSRQNALCKTVRSLQNRKGRREHGLFAAEGENAVAAALAAGWPLHSLLVTARLSPRYAAHPPQLPVYELASELLAWLADSETSPGVIALAKLPKQAEPVVPAAGLTLLLDGVADAGNVGALIRSADAAGAGAVVAAEGCADIYSPKVVRATAGSFFNVPLHAGANAAALVEAAQARQVPLVIAAAHQGEDCFQFRWPERCVLALGHETRGISPEVEQAAQARVTIPVYGRAESLNVAAAGAVLMYAWRQAAAR